MAEAQTLSPSSQSEEEEKSDTQNIEQEQIKEGKQTMIFVFTKTQHSKQHCISYRFFMLSSTERKRVREKERQRVRTLYYENFRSELGITETQRKLN